MHIARNPAPRKPGNSAKSLGASVPGFLAWQTPADQLGVVPAGPSLRRPSPLPCPRLALLRRDLLIDLLRYFTAFGSDGRTAVKKIAAYHQCHAAKKDLDKGGQAAVERRQGGRHLAHPGVGQALADGVFCRDVGKK